MTRKNFFFSLSVFVGLWLTPGIALAGTAGTQYDKTVAMLIIAVGAVNIVLALGAAVLTRGGMLGAFSLWFLAGTVLASSHFIFALTGVSVLDAIGDFSVGLATIAFIIGSYRLVKFLKDLAA